MKPSRMASIVCMDRSHQRKPAVTGVLARDDLGAWHPRAQNTPEDETFFRPWDGDSKIDGPTDHHLLHEGVYRRRLTFKCPLCGVSLEARGERLDKALDELWDEAAESPLMTSIDTGVLPIPLGLLAARVAST